MTELTRMLNRKRPVVGQGCKSTPTVSGVRRFLSFPAVLFERVFETLLPTLKARWHQRTRPIPTSLEYGLKHFEQILAADGSVLEALFRKLDSLQDIPAGTLAGKICTVIELTTRLPVKIWFNENAKAHDCCFLDDLLSWVSAKTLLILDRGFYDFSWWLNWSTKKLTSSVRASRI